MTIGLPRAMLFYRYGALWETFFKELGCDVVISGETSRQTLCDGIKYSIDECCLPSKIYMGHVYSLIGRCDYILVPRVAGYDGKNDVCVKFNALCDIVRNTFETARVLDYNIDIAGGETELRAFLRMGLILGKSAAHTLSAYRKARLAQAAEDRRKSELQEKALSRRDGMKILIVSHPYNNYDRLIGRPVSRYIEKLGGICVFADAADRVKSLRLSRELSESLYWLYNKELVGAIRLLEDRVDGIILLTAFPCGPDSLVNELILRKSLKVPTINILLDELQAEAGLQTRIESFMDIIGERARAAKAAQGPKEEAAVLCSARKR